MSDKITHTINTNINPNIKVGDLVMVVDGSAFSIKNTDKHDKDLYIIYAYPELTGLDIPIKHIPAIVTKTGVTDKGCIGAVNSIYLQDIIILIGKTKFRTSSRHVTVINKSNI